MNRSIFTKIGAFIIGAGVGAAVAYKVMDVRCSQRIQDEVNSVKEVYSLKYSSGDDKVIKNQNGNEKTTSTDDILEAKKIIDDSEYATESDSKENNGKDKENMNELHVISPEEVGDCDYTVITLWHYSDGTVTNDEGKVISNVEELIGKDYADHFGEYEEDPDAVYVRNDNQEVDYEVLKDSRDFSDIN